MTTTIFGAATPALGNEADGIDYALGTRFTTSTAGNVTAMRWFYPTTTPSAVTAVTGGIYDVSGPTLLGSATFSLSPTLGDWNTATLSSPVPIVAGVTYAAVIWTPLRYVATSAYGWPVTSGALTAGASNGWLTASPGSLAFPTTLSGGSASYFADVVFEPSSWLYGFEVRIG